MLDAHMDLLDFRSNLFGIAGVVEHAERYRYRMNPHALGFVLERLEANSFSNERVRLSSHTRQHRDVIFFLSTLKC